MNVNILVVTDAYNPLINRILSKAGNCKRFLNRTTVNETIPFTDGVCLAQINTPKDLRKTFEAIKQAKNTRTACVWGLSYSTDVVTRKDLQVLCAT